uniref:V-type proton ATPase subunit a n=1 Tax=Plectus sambesii TaxID=2011161 RepID=A0A914V4L4_9BILA
TQKCLIAECWCPTSDLDKIQLALKRGTEESGSTVPSILNRMDTDEMPPTYHRVNKFTRGFQNIVDSYGIATYREVNPAPYTIITFPFLFAVMFGDTGHGVIMLAAGLFFVLKEKALEAKRINDEIFQTFFGGRYVILLMGCFSIYTGLIYNDFYSKSVNIFGSSWRNPYTEIQLDGLEEDVKLILPPEYAFQDDGPYPFGVDPVWNLAENKLNFLNSMKMKSSIILGICQMTFGVVLSLMNYRYFKSTVDILTMFIPQMLFLGCIFIYLCLQVIMKWLFFSTKAEYIFGRYYPGSHCAPSLLIGLINMFMMKSREAGFVSKVPVNGSEPVPGDEFQQCYLTQWYPGQSFFEGLFVLVAICCIPFMLFAKPYLLHKEHRLRRLNGGANL